MLMADELIYELQQSLLLVASVSKRLTSNSQAVAGKRVIRGHAPG